MRTESGSVRYGLLHINEYARAYFSGQLLYFWALRILFGLFHSTQRAILNVFSLT